MLTHQVDGDPPRVGTLTEVAAICTVDHAVEGQASACLQRRRAIIETLDRIESVVAETGKPVDHIVLISNNVAAFDLAAERGWLTVWLNRDRVANLSDVMPSAEIHSLLDLPEVLEAIEEARAAVADLDPEPTAPA